MLLSAICAYAQAPLPQLSLSNVVFEADELERTGSGSIIRLRGNVILDNGEAVLVADNLTIEPDAKKALAEGNVRLEFSDGEQVLAQSLVLDQATTTLLLSGLAVRLRDEAILAAAEAATDGDDLRLSYVAYTACEAPCDIEAHRQRNPLPWQLTARRVDLNAANDTLRLTDVRLELFEVPVARWPFSLSVPAPYVERRSGVLGPVGGYSTDEGGWAGLPLYLTLGPSADTTITPILYSTGLGRLDSELRLNTGDVEAEASSSFDTTGEVGGQVETTLALTPALDLSLDWMGESTRGTLHRLEQTDLSLHTNSLSLQAMRGHSFYEAGFYQDRLLTTEPDWLSLDWQEDWIPRAQYDLRLPPFAGGNRVRLQGQGLLLSDRALVANEASYTADLVTPGGLKLTPTLAAGWVGDDAAATADGWLGGQMKAALPLIRHSAWSSTTLTPHVAITGLSGLDTADSPYMDSSVPSRANLFDIRSSADRFNHAGNLRSDVALDFSLYPTRATAFGLRGSLGQRLSWGQEALDPATAEIFAHAGELSIDFRAHVDLPAFTDEAIDWNKALPRLALGIDVPLTPWVTMSGEHHRLTTALDQAESNRLQMDFDWGGGIETIFAVTTDTGRDETDMSLESALAWNFQGDWVAETAIRQNVFDLDDQDLSFDLFHRCDCLGAQIGVLRERRADGTDLSARFALDLPTLFSGAVSPRLPFGQ